MNATRPDLFICRALFPYIIVGPMVLFTILLTILSTSGPVQAMPNAADWDDQFFLNGLNGDVYALAIDSQGAVYAGGYFSGADSTTVNNIAKWDGTSWSALDGGVSGVMGVAVTALAVDSNDDLYVGGYFDTAGSGAITVRQLHRQVGRHKLVCPGRWRGRRHEWFC